MKYKNKISKILSQNGFYKNIIGPKKTLVRWGKKMVIRIDLIRNSNEMKGIRGLKRNN